MTVRFCKAMLIGCAIIAALGLIPACGVDVGVEASDDYVGVDVGVGVGHRANVDVDVDHHPMCGGVEVDVDAYPDCCECDWEDDGICDAYRHECCL